MVGRAIQRPLERATIPFCEEQLRRRPLQPVQAEGSQLQQRERAELGIVKRLAARKPTAPPRPADAVAASGVHPEACTTAEGQRHPGP
jgi:hypothetical protein